MPFSKLSRSTDALTVACLISPMSFQVNDGNAVRLGESLFLENPLPPFVISVTTWTRLMSRFQLFIRCYSSCEICASIPFWSPCIPFVKHPVFHFCITLYFLLGSHCILFLDHLVLIFWITLYMLFQLWNMCFSSFLITLYSVCETPCIPFLYHLLFSFGITLHSFFRSSCINFLDHSVYYFH